MHVSTTALYTLAALIAGDLTQQAIAKPVSTATPERPEASDIESAAERSLPSSMDAVTPPEQLQAIAFAEAVLTQYSEEYTRELTGVSAEDTAVAVPADSSPTETELAAIEVLATMQAPEIMGVEHSAYHLNGPAESFEIDPQTVPLTDPLVEDAAVEDAASPTEELAFDLASFSTYQEIAVAPPEAIAIPERMPESVPKVIEAIAIPEFFMPERSEQWFDDIEAPVNVLLPTTLSSESTQTYALSDVEADEDLWIQAMIESEFAEQAPTADWVAVAPAFESVYV